MIGVQRVLSLAWGGALAAGLLLLGGCERPPMDTVQGGYRGTGMLQVYNPRTLAGQEELNQVPAAMPAVPDEGPRAKEAFKNVQVLGDLSAGAFTRHMVSITSWVAPQQGCVYCHNLENLADDSKYTKVVARRMIQMTQAINANWKNHVAGTGVTCHTCHRGQPVPAQLWFQATGQPGADFIGNRNGQNEPLKAAGLSSLPVDPYSAYLKAAQDIRVAGATALPTSPNIPIQNTEKTYGLMMHMSKALGVNCTYCHNTRSFGTWSESTPKRTVAWHGIRMVRELNGNFMEPLTATFPPERRGEAGDVAKVYCGTCHQGAFKPLYGAQMAKDFPELLTITAPDVGITPVTTPAAAASAADGAQPDTSAGDTSGLPAPVAEPNKSVLYFDVGSPELKADQAKGLEQIVSTLMAQPDTKATISGFHSAAGTLAQNQELAKQRAFKVRDSLIAAGIAESRVTLEKPQQTEANSAGEDATARRVEVTVQ